NDRVVNMAAVVAVGVRTTGDREVLGFDLGPAETYEFWVTFLRSLVRRGLGGVRLVISDAHEGLRQAIAEVLQGAAWQRCRVHFMRNLLGYVPKQAQSMVAALVRTVFAQPDIEAAREQLDREVASLGRRYPKVAALLTEAAEDVLAYMAFPREHWQKIHSTNPLERLMREIGRRVAVVGIFPNAAAALRLIGAVLQEQEDEWRVQRRDLSMQSVAKLAVTRSETEAALVLDACARKRACSRREPPFTHLTGHDPVPAWAWCAQEDSSARLRKRIHFLSGRKNTCTHSGLAEAWDRADGKDLGRAARQPGEALRGDGGRLPAGWGALPLPHPAPEARGARLRRGLGLGAAGGMPVARRTHRRLRRPGTVRGDRAQAAPVRRRLRVRGLAGLHGRGAGRGHRHPLPGARPLPLATGGGGRRSVPAAPGDRPDPACGPPAGGGRSRLNLPEHGWSCV